MQASPTNSLFSVCAHQCHTQQTHAHTHTYTHRSKHAHMHTVHNITLVHMHVKHTQVRGGYTIAPLQEYKLNSSPESLITCIMKVISQLLIIIPCAVPIGSVLVNDVPVDRCTSTNTLFSEHPAFLLTLFSEHPAFLLNFKRWEVSVLIDDVLYA